MQEEKDHGGTSLTEGAAVSVSASDQLPHDARARILAKGQGWCSVTHSHDNSKAALAAATETLTILAERYTEKGYRTPEMLTALLSEVGSGTDSSEAKRADERAGAHAPSTSSHSDPEVQP